MAHIKAISIRLIVTNINGAAIQTRHVPVRVAIQNQDVYAHTPGVLPAWIVVDEFHLLKSMAKGAGPWQSIMDMRKCAEDFPSLIAMSGTPVSIGPADFKGPLMCLTNDRATLFPPNRSSYRTFSLHHAHIRCRSSRVAAEI